MRAGRFPGSRIKSPSWRNELKQKEIRQKARHPTAGLFACCGCGALGLTPANCPRSCFYWHLCNKADVRFYARPIRRLRIERPLWIGFASIASAAAAEPSRALRGYPVPTSKKKRACVVTYRHSGDRLFENSFPPQTNVNDL